LIDPEKQGWISVVARLDTTDTIALLPLLIFTQTRFKYKLQGL